jgi:hypothetical protein
MQVVTTPALKERVTALKKLIKTASALREFKNFNGLYAIVSGLSLLPVARLKETWEALPSKHKQTFEVSLQIDDWC